MKNNIKKTPDLRGPVKLLPNTPRTLGPVPDLEQHLPSDWWRTLFNSLYLKTDGDVIENQENTRQEVDFVVNSSGVADDSYILDLCCGQGRHSLELARRGYKHVVGVDRSRYLIRLAKKRSREEHLNTNFHEGDARKFRLKGMQFDCVALMGNSFGYFERPSDDQAVLNNVAFLLKPEGKLVLDVVDGEWMKDNFERRSWEWIDQNHFVCRERAIAKDGWRIVAREVIVHAERGVIADQFYAERLYTRDQLNDLLAHAGFRRIQFHGKVESDSTRGQDLGMMGHRLLLSASAPTKTVVTRPKKFPAYSKVTVIMGDPELPDIVKLGHQFNPEDFDTIKRLKDSLKELTDYEFSYYNDHKALLLYLQTKTPSFILNLCDEGFTNDPFQELHVPAILEMLKIPYTGAGPACLGLCYNKSLIRSIAESIEVPVPMESYLDADDVSATLPATFPALIKPCYGDSSMGITKNAVVSNSSELMSYIEGLRRDFGPAPILIQEFLMGKEYSVGIIGNPGLSMKILPILEVDYSRLDPDLPQILGYESKWDPKSPYWTKIGYKQAELDENTRHQLYDHANALFKRTGCRDYARFDFRADSEGRIKLLEVNPNPGWCWDGKLNIMAGFDGISYTELLKMILEAAQERITANQM